jgi:deoxyribodipyrimidine photolyase
MYGDNSKEFDKYDAYFIREYMPELIGGEEIADKADNGEVRFMAKINDKIAELDREKQQLEKMLEQIKKKIKAREL